MDFSDNRAEADKRLDAALLAGDSIIAIDNIERPLGGVGLCQALTEVSKEVRPLGSSNKVSVPCTSLFIATGNNIQVSGDMDRRVLFCRLDPQTEQPEQRDIDQDLIAETLERRADLVADCQTIILAHRLSGHVGPPSLGSFGDWSRDIRDALIWLGMANPQDSMELAKANDPEREETLAFCNAMFNAFGTTARTCAEIVRQAENDTPMLDALAAVCGGKVTTKALGFWLRSRKDRVVGEYVIAAGREAKAGTSRWMVRPNLNPTEIRAIEKMLDR